MTARKRERPAEEGDGAEDGGGGGGAEEDDGSRGGGGAEEDDGSEGAVGEEVSIFGATFVVPFCPSSIAALFEQSPDGNCCRCGSSASFCSSNSPPAECLSMDVWMMEQ